MLAADVSPRQAEVVAKTIDEQSPGLDSNLVLPVYAVHFVFTPTGGETQVVDASKPAPGSGRLDVCTQHEEGPRGVFDGTYWVSYTPA